MSEDVHPQTKLPWRLPSTLMAFGFMVFGGLMWFGIERLLAYASVSASTEPLQDLREDAVGLISPLLDCPVTSVSTKNVTPLEQKLESLVKQMKVDKRADNISIYFHDLRGGSWVGVDADREYYAASLEKVPVMLTYYRLSLTDPTLLTKKIEYHDIVDHDAVQNIKPSEGLKLGESYANADLIEKMIVNSDNNAFYLLWNQVPSEQVENTFRDIGVPISYTPGVDFSVSPRNFSRFFRVLYNATYLDRDLSQRGLDLLSRAEYSQGLRSDIPTSVVIAHKFGEHSDIPLTDKMPGPMELHDCGIIYHPWHPYFLCVMTSGSDMTSMQNVISDVSHTVFQFVDYNFQTGL